MPVPDVLLTPEEYAREERLMLNCAQCQRFRQIRRLLAEFPGDVLPPGRRDILKAALQDPELHHRLQLHPKWQNHQLAIIRQRQGVLRSV